jgi:hypothetical protein
MRSHFVVAVKRAGVAGRNRWDEKADRGLDSTSRCPGTGETFGLLPLIQVYKEAV